MASKRSEYYIPPETGTILCKACGGKQHVNISSFCFTNKLCLNCANKNPVRIEYDANQTEYDTFPEDCIYSATYFSDEQQNFLKRHNINYGQAYYYSRKFESSVDGVNHILELRRTAIPKSE